MSRRRRVTCLVLFVFGAGLEAQQPNTPNSTLTVNFTNHASGGSGPISINASPGGSLVLTMRGQPLQPVILASAPVVSPGVSIAPYGILDIGFPFFVLVDGFNPQTVFDLFAVTNQSGTFEVIGSILNGSPIPSLGFQGAVGDPTAPGGALLTAATSVTVGAFTTNTTTFAENLLGDDVTVTYYHQALSFPFYGTNYGRTNIDTNGYLSFGSPFPSQFLANIGDFLSRGPRIAPYWSDLHMSSTAPSTFGYVSVAPASIVVTESAPGPGVVVMQIDWLRATEAVVAPGTGGGVPGNQFDFRVVLSNTGLITFTYGSALGPGNAIAAAGNIVAIAGISPGSNLSPVGTSRDLVVGGVVSPYTAAAPLEAIFERFDPSMAAFTIDLVGPGGGVNFQPLGPSGAPNQIYSLF